MKKFFLITILGALSFATANDNTNGVALINSATNDLRGIEVDDEECQKAIIEFYALISKNSNDDIKSSKEYRECMKKKENARLHLQEVQMNAEEQNAQITEQNQTAEKNSQIGESNQTAKFGVQTDTNKTKQI